MSVIAGVIQFDRPLHPEDGTADFMEAVQQFPGDGFETWEDTSVLLGCRSQWITLESVNERLPFRDEQSGLVITADAIIDNRAQLFEQLEIGRDRRSGITDSELILLAYRKWGPETPRYLIGDFAFVIWDASRKLLYGARDQLASRTLYYHHSSNQFSFCSVIHPLFSLAGIDKRLCEERFAEFLAIPTLLDAVDVHTTYYADILQLPPAHAFTLQEGKLTVAKYGSLMPEERLTLSSDDEYVEAFQEILPRIDSLQTAYLQAGGSHPERGTRFRLGFRARSEDALQGRQELTSLQLYSRAGFHRLDAQKHVCG